MNRCIHHSSTCKKNLSILSSHRQEETTKDDKQDSYTSEPGYGYLHRNNLNNHVTLCPLREQHSGCTAVLRVTALTSSIANPVCMTARSVGATAVVKAVEWDAHDDRGKREKSALGDRGGSGDLQKN